MISREVFTCFSCHLEVAQLSLSLVLNNQFYLQMDRVNFTLDRPKSVLAGDDAEAGLTGLKGGKMSRAATRSSVNLDVLGSR